MKLGSKIKAFLALCIIMIICISFMIIKQLVKCDINLTEIYLHVMYTKL